jgi:hypothetical protein
LKFTSIQDLVPNKFHQFIYDDDEKESSPLIHYRKTSSNKAAAKSSKETSAKSSDILYQDGESLKTI